MDFAAEIVLGHWVICRRLELAAILDADGDVGLADIDVARLLIDAFLSHRLLEVGLDFVGGQICALAHVARRLRIRLLPLLRMDGRARDQGEDGRHSKHHGLHGCPPGFDFRYALRAATIATFTVSTIRSRTSFGVISGGARQIVSPMAGSGPPPRMRRRRPRRSASLATFAPSPIAGALLALSATSSTPHIMPSPRTSPTSGRSDSMRSPSSRCFPIVAARSGSPSFSMMSRLASPTAQQTGWPEYV